MHSIVKLASSFLCVVMIPIFIFFSNHTVAMGINGVGLKSIDFIDPVSHGLVKAVAFYPSFDSSSVTHIGPYEIAATKSLRVSNGVYPLILFSHGSMGSMWGHHDLAIQLVKKGFIVVSVTHPGDNFKDSSRIGTTSNIYGRPLQISAALSSVIHDSILWQHIDKEKIGFLGFSAGGTTGLILAGAKPDLTRLTKYCSTRKNDNHVCEANGNVRIDHQELNPISDKRIKSFVLLAPLSVLFSPNELQSIKSPLRIIVGDNDEELSPNDNAIAVAKNSNSKLDIIRNAGHFIFLSPCSHEMSQEAPAICNDPKGVNRISVHKKLNADIYNFYMKTLN